MATDIEWKVGNWAVFDLNIVQIKEIRDYGMTVSEGDFETSGQLADRLRPLTLRNKITAERFDYYYNQLRKIDGEGGFNYPDISRHFCNLSLKAIDGDEKDRTPFDDANKFVECAKDYNPVIQGIRLFRRI